MGAGLALSMMIGVAQAASLTNDQVTAIMNLLQSFGADQSVINNVKTSLTGGTPSGMPGRRDDDSRGWQGAPGQSASSTPGIPGKGENRSTVAKCILLNRTLKQGSQGDDVKDFQQMLKDEGKFEGMPSGFFGAMTAKAVAKWQEEHGIASSTSGGIVGMMTRKFLENRCPPPMKPQSTASTTRQ